MYKLGFLYIMLYKNALLTNMLLEKTFEFTPNPITSKQPS